MKVTLKVRYQNNKIQEQVLKRGTIAVLGRSSKCDWRLEDEKVSSRHCRLNLKHNGLEIVDLDSRNGTYLNGIRIEQSELFLGDELKLGDTVITLEDKDADAEAFEVLTFPGPMKDRLAYELKADFTGARVKNQRSGGRRGKAATKEEDDTRKLEIELRKKIKSKIKLSKEEIRARYRFTGVLASFVDVGSLLILLAAPLLLIGHFAPQAKGQERLTIILTLEGLFLATFLLVNFKLSKFTLGEKLTGISKIYSQQ
jgi:pSer/pThr/pTyr-binding forkhead associated (FHA) protein